MSQTMQRMNMPSTSKEMPVLNGKSSIETDTTSNKIRQRNLNKANYGNYETNKLVEQQTRSLVKDVLPAPVTEVREYLFKLLVIGDMGTGKTCFIKRYVHQYFCQNYRATVNISAFLL